MVNKLKNFIKIQLTKQDNSLKITTQFTIILSVLPNLNNLPYNKKIVRKCDNDNHHKNSFNYTEIINLIFQFYFYIL